MKRARDLIALTLVATLLSFFSASSADAKSKIPPKKIPPKPAPPAPHYYAYSPPKYTPPAKPAPVVNKSVSYVYSPPPAPKPPVTPPAPPKSKPIAPAQTKQLISAPASFVTTVSDIKVANSASKVTSYEQGTPKLVTGGSVAPAAKVNVPATSNVGTINFSNASFSTAGKNSVNTVTDNLQNQIDQLAASGGGTIKIVVQGSASNSGSAAANAILAKNRAITATNTLAGSLDVPPGVKVEYVTTSAKVSSNSTMSAGVSSTVIPAAKPTVPSTPPPSTPPPSTLPPSTPPPSTPPPTFTPPTPVSTPPIVAVVQPVTPLFRAMLESAAVSSPPPIVQPEPVVVPEPAPVVQAPKPTLAPVNPT